MIDPKDFEDAMLVDDYVDDQYKWLLAYSINAIEIGRLCKKYPAMQHAWNNFKTTFELCRSQDEVQ